MATSTPLLQRRLTELLALGPAMAEAFKRAGLAGCLGCSMAEFETLADAVKHFDVDAEYVQRVLAPAARRLSTVK